MMRTINFIVYAVIATSLFLIHILKGFGNIEHWSFSLMLLGLILFQNTCIYNKLQEIKNG